MKFFLVFSFIFLIYFTLIYRWHLALHGRLLTANGKFYYRGIISLGGKRRGFMIIVEKDRKSLSLGRIEKPFVIWTFSKKGGIRRGRDKISPEKLVDKKDKKRAYLELNERNVWKITLKETVNILRNHVVFDSFKLEGKLGLGNPVFTGLLYGAFRAIRSLLLTRKCSINFSPDFTGRPVSDITCNLKLSFRPVFILGNVGNIYFHRFIKNKVRRRRYAYS